VTPTVAIQNFMKQDGWFTNANSTNAVVRGALEMRQKMLQCRIFWRYLVALVPGGDRHQNLKPA